MYRKTPFEDMNASIKKVELEELAKGNAYPVTVVMDRYGGTYSGAKWLAFNVDPQYVPEEVGGSDPEESIYWLEHKDSEFPIGKGSTPDNAIQDLIKKLKAYYET
jgi:hypothetical protein